MYLRIQFNENEPGRGSNLRHHGSADAFASHCYDGTMAHNTVVENSYMKFATVHNPYNLHKPLKTLIDPPMRETL